MAEDTIFTDEYFRKLDKLVTFRIPKDWDKIHLVNGWDDGYIDICRNMGYKEPKVDFFGFVQIPAKEVVQIVKDRKFNIKIGITRPNLKTVTALWAIKDAVGRPYVKHWTQLIAFYKDKGLTEPLTYTGDGSFKNDFYREPGTRDWNYKMANALLGLEEHNDVLLKFWGDKSAIERACSRVGIPVPAAVQNMKD